MRLNNSIDESEIVLSGNITNEYRAADSLLSGSLVSAYQSADSSMSGSLVNSINTKLSLSGGDMIGPITLSADPTLSGHVTSKKYVDSQINTTVTLSGDQEIHGLKSFSSNVVVKGDLAISGNVISTEKLLVEDNYILLNSTFTGTPSLNAGIGVERGALTNSLIEWNEVLDQWEAGISGTLEKIVRNSDIATLSSTLTSGYISADTTLSNTLTTNYQNADTALSGALTFNWTGNEQLYNETLNGTSLYAKCLSVTFSGNSNTFLQALPSGATLISLQGVAKIGSTLGQFPIPFASNVANFSITSYIDTSYNLVVGFGSVYSSGTLNGKPGYIELVYFK